jgi:AraC family transcriptional regulator of adaptative response / DNA-3-methyladenine glycosylase II
MLKSMKKLEMDDFKKIIARRDPHYDGRFFFGVKTTGIYCRPVCPAKPKPENILIFKSASEAEKSGYRPCLRCHPDLAPGSKLLLGTTNTVMRSLRLLEESVEEELNVEHLAEKVGVTDRHLRRLFDEHLGASPVEIFITRRLHLAKQMILQTHKPVSEIAFASGFHSVRRFNEAFKELYHQSPSAFRGPRDQHPQKGALVLKLLVRPPYDFKMVLAYLKRHETYGIERVTETEYARFLPQQGSLAFLKVREGAKGSTLEVHLNGVPLSEVRPILAGIKNLFDVEHNPHHLPKYGAKKLTGVRVPGSFDSFETAVSIILSQLVSTTQAKNQMKALILRYGRKVGEDALGEIFEFPEPAKLAAARVEELGLTRVKAQAIRELAALIRDKKIRLTPGAEIEPTRARLLEIQGVGPWTVEMIAMRCLGDSDAFPRKDLIVQRALEQDLVDEEAWISSRAYLTHCIWRDFSERLSKISSRKKEK